MKCKLLVSFLGGLLMIPGNVRSQSGPLVMSAGYEYQTPIYVASGQLLTLFVSGVPPTTPFARVVGISDLPLSLSGISVGMWQGDSRPVPIVEVRPFDHCFRPGYGCYPLTTAAITVQIPFEVQNYFDVCSQPRTGCVIPALQFTVAANGQAAFSIQAGALPDKIRILKTLDSVLPIAPAGPYGYCYSATRYANSAPDNITGLPCPPMVAHADGSLVSAKNPAKAGEELVAYAVGLGQTSPPSETGRIVTSPAPTVTTFALDFNYRRNALPTRPPPADTPGVPKPLYAGTTPGYVGLYQVNFVVPPVPPGTPPCAEVDNNNRFDNLVYSNLTVSVGGRSSFDGAGICVAVDTSQVATPGREGGRVDK